MNQKTQFCNGALAEQIEKWQMILEKELEKIMLIKTRIIDQERGTQNERIGLNKQVQAVIDNIYNEFNIYKIERAKLEAGESEFTGIMRKYEDLSSRFNKISMDLSFVFKQAQDYKEGINMYEYGTKPEIEWQIKDDYQMIIPSLDEFQISSQKDEVEEQTNDKITNNPKKFSFLNETFNSKQNGQLSQLRLQELKNLNNFQTQKPTKDKSSNKIDEIQNYLLNQQQIQTNINTEKKKPLNVCPRQNSRTRERSFDDREDNSKQKSLSFLLPVTIQKGLKTQKSSSSCEKNNKSTLQNDIYNKNNNQSAKLVLEREVNRLKQLVKEQTRDYQLHNHSLLCKK